MMPIDISKATLPSIDAVFSIAQDNHTQIPANDGCCEEIPLVKTNLKRRRLKKRNEYLHRETMRKMIWRILTEKHMPEEKLAHALGITIKSLKQFCSKNCPLTLVPKINLPLIKLYCVTKFNV
ncbi:hypothetical protein GAMM_170093 [Gammaproteobacteria bacterium]